MLSALTTLITRSGAAGDGAGAASEAQPPRSTSAIRTTRDDTERGSISRQGGAPSPIPWHLATPLGRSRNVRNSDAAHGVAKPVHIRLPGAMSERLMGRGHSQRALAIGLGLGLWAAGCSSGKPGAADRA